MEGKELRELEKLKTSEDYSNEIKFVKDTVCGTKKADREIDKILEDLTKAWHEKYKYIIKISKPYTKKQGLFSLLADWWKDKKEQRRANKEARAEAKEQRKVAEEQRQSQSQTDVSEQKDTSSLPASPTTQRVELLGGSVKQLTDNASQ